MYVRTCICESLPQQTEAVRCYMNSYSEFLRQRQLGATVISGNGGDGSGSSGNGVIGGTSTKLFEAYNRGEVTRIEEIVHDPITCPTLTSTLAESIILQSFLKRYCKTHPKFAQRVKTSNFKTKSELFHSI